MAINRKVLSKQYASTEKNIEVPKRFMAFLRTLEIGRTIHVRIMCICIYLPSIKGYSQHHEICALLKIEPRREIKLPSSNEYLCLKAAAHQPIFCRPTKKSSFAGECAVNSDKSATRSGLVGQHLTVLDLKTSCRSFSPSVRWTKTICRGSRAPQPIRKCHESHVSGIGAILILGDSAPSLVATKNRLVCGKLMTRKILTRFGPDKKSSVLRQKIG